MNSIEHSTQENPLPCDLSYEFGPDAAEDAPRPPQALPVVGAPSSPPPIAALAKWQNLFRWIVALAYVRLTIALIAVHIGRASP